MKKIIIIAILVLLVLSITGCAKVYLTSGSLSARQADGSLKIDYTFKNVPKAVDNGNVYLNGELVGSGTGKGTVVFYNTEPNPVFTLSTDTMTLAEIAVHIK